MSDGNNNVNNRIYKYEEISNKVLRGDKRLLDEGPRSLRSTVDTTPHSLKGVISSNDFGSNIKPVIKERDSKELEDIDQLIQKSITGKSNKSLKKKNVLRRDTPKLNSLLDTDTIETLDYIPTTEENVAVYNEIIAWCSLKLDNDLPDYVINSLADIIIGILKSDNVNTLEKKKQVEDSTNQKINDEDFQRIASLVDRIDDYNDDSSKNIGNDEDDGLGIMLDSDGNVDNDDDDDDDEEDDGGDDDYDDIHNDNGDVQDIQDEHELLNQEIEDPEDVVKLDNNVKNAFDTIEIDSIDKYWITKQLANHQPQMDSYKKTEVSNLIFQYLKDVVTQKINVKTFERNLSAIPELEMNDLYYKLIKNYKKIYYGIELASTDDEAIKLQIHHSLDSSEGVNKRKPADDDDDNENMLKKRKTIEAGKISLASITYPRNIDIRNLIFTQGSKMMTISKFNLPKGSFKRTRKSWEEIHIPPPEKAKLEEDEVLVPISDLPEWTQSVFPSTEMKTLNRIQSKVYPSAFNDDCNILMCAPTGAGKTNVAMLTVLRTLSNFRNSNGKFLLNNFKIVYIAPLKALVQEQVREFDRRLSHLGITVNELTGDSNLTRHQIESTQILVTTPEKWDVITRKNNDASYINLVRLIIIDEIHLLHDERGPVIENIVSRTMRNMTDDINKKVRFVALSATLPNYKDVAQFLRVEKQGLFYFDASYRPCPLAQQFVGITEKKAFKKYEAMNEICYEKIIENINDGNQVIIFVHSRKETTKTARWLANKLVEDEKLSSLMKFSTGVKEILKTESENARNKGLKSVLPMGFGVHHAGMNRADRQTAEDLFAEGHIKVLVSTATLAWGVNLPAHTVIIKGTSVYSPEKGTWVDLSPQDILQMLGRAGRPRYDTHGDGIIITSQDQIKYYLAVLNQQLPIESQMYAKLVDSINAEIVSGSVNSLGDCVDWLGYTYLYVRMLHSRDIYFVGPQYDNDSELLERRKDLAYSALLLLAKNGLIKYNYSKDVIVPTALGKIASHYYISYVNMKNFDNQLKPTFSEIELFRLFAQSEEFKYIPVRREEKIELQKLVEKAPIPINEDVEDPLSKINILLQAYISGLQLDGFALMADLVFIAQSAGRLFRALYDLALHKGWAKLARLMLNICKMVEKRLWLTSTPLRQYPHAPIDVINVAEKSLTPWNYYLALDNPSLVVRSLKAEKYGNLVWEMVQKFPQIKMHYNLEPITPSLLQIVLEITPHWKWDVSLHGFMESFTLLVEDCDCEKILYNDQFLVRKDFINNPHTITITVPLFESKQPNYFVSLISDRWLFCEKRIPLMLTKLITPKKFPAPTPLIESSLVPILELGIKEFSTVFPFEYFNKFQSQAFDSVYNNKESVLFGSSKGNGKTTVAILALLNHWKTEGNRAVYINPSQRLIDSLCKKWKKSLTNLAGGKVINKFTDDININLQILAQSHLIMCTPTQLENLSRRWHQRKSIQSIELIIADDFHNIGAGLAGASYEMTLNRFKYIESKLEKQIRFVVLSSSIASYKDVVDWLTIPKSNTFNFDTRERIYPLEVKFKYMDIRNNDSFLKCLIRPTYKYVNNMDDNNGDETCLVFVSDKANVLQVSKGILRRLKTENNTWLQADESSLKPYLNKVKDPFLKICLECGIGFYHESLASVDQTIIFNLFKASVLKCLVATKNSSSWCVPANNVLILGTQEYQGKEHGYVDYTINDILEMTGLARKNDILHANSVVFTNSPKMDYYKRFMSLALPLESHWNDIIHDAIISDIRIIKNRQYAIDWITYSLFYRKIQLNPSFYKLSDTSDDGLSEYLSELVENALSDLSNAGLVELDTEEEEAHESSNEEGEENELEKVEITPLNACMVANYYGISFFTVEILNKLNGKVRLKRILEIICLASEFDSLPIREHESSHLYRLYNNLPLNWSMDADFETPALKTFILLQAYFSRFELSADFKDDLDFILPIANKLVYACVDILAGQGLLSAMLAMDLSQMISQGMWNNDNILKQVPMFTQDIISKCEKYEVKSVYDIMELEDEDRNDILAGLDEKEVSAVADFVNKYPNLEVTYHLEGDIIAGVPKEIAIDISRDEEVEDVSVVSARYPDKKSENWWIVIGDSKMNELYSIKKMAITKENQLIKMHFTIPEKGKHDICVWCVCDSYIDSDKQVEITGLEVK